MLVLFSSYILAGALLAMASEEQLPFYGSGYFDEERPCVINCDPHLDSKCNSPSLEQIASNMTDNSLRNTVTIDIRITHLQLKSNVKFFELESLTISGDADLNTTITCQEGNFAGLIFRNISRLTIRRLMVMHCGAILNNFTYSSAVTILHSRNVTADNLIISRSKGIGLTILDHQGGFVQIESSQFFENKPPKDGPTYRGGGGVYVGGFEQDPSEPISFRFSNCTFQNNVAHTVLYDYLYTDDLGEPVGGYGLGGGAAVLLEGGLTDIHVIFSKCTFTRNKAFKGGGLIMEIEGTPDSETRNISLMVEASLFKENGYNCSNSTVSGGGIHINFATHDRTKFYSNHVVIFDVNFFNNCAQFGGGLYFYSDLDRSTDQSNTIDVEQCIFKRNKAHTGSAVDITPNVFQRLSSGIRTTPVFRDCTFVNNTVYVNFHANRTQTTYGIGTLYISLYNIKFEGYNRFENNTGTGIHIVNGNINMSQSSITFFNNFGIQGGAVALIGESSIIVGPNRTYEFINNTALGKGGALYVQLIDNHDVTASKTCFFQYFDGNRFFPAREWTANITFTGNRANAGTGHAIFATSFYPCQAINNGTVEKLRLKSVDPSKVFKERRITIENFELEGHSIATEGAQLHNKRDFPIEVIPGERFKHGVTITDDLNCETKVVLTASIQNSSSVKLGTAFSSCIGEQLVLRGEPDENALLYLQTITSRMSYVRLEMKLTECPPGYKFNKVRQVCVCNYRKYTGLVECSRSTFHSYITPGFWAGLVADTKNKTREELVTSYCPLKFCNYNGTDTTGSAVKLPQKACQLDDAMCGRSRTGTTCGSCAQDYTTHFHSPNFICNPVDPTLCKVGWLFYILSELVPVTLVFIIVLALNISFTAGAVNGFILFSQLLTSLHLDASGFITFTPAIATLTRGHQLIYGFFNLDMFQIESFSFCLWPNASALDMLAFKYVTIVYALLLVMLVIWFMNKCHNIRICLGKYCRISTVKSSVIHGVSAFLILCHSQCLKVSLNLLSGYHLTVRKGSNLNVSKRVTLNGNILYFSRQHLPYALPALFFLLTIGIIPPILLLAYPLFNKVLAFFGFEESKLVHFISRVLPISSLKPLLDSFQGCFKDNLRFFAGLYFIYRWMPLLLDIFISSFSVFYTAVEALIIVISTLHVLFQPYARKGHNMVDALLFADLALINAITFAHYHIFRTKVGRQLVTEYITPSVITQLVLIYLPLLVAAVYVLVLVCRSGCGQRRQSESPKLTSVPLRKLKDFVSSIGKEDNCDSEDLPHRLVAGDVKYECFEDTDRITYVTNGTYSETNNCTTY